MKYSLQWTYNRLLSRTNATNDFTNIGIKFGPHTNIFTLITMNESIHFFLSHL